MVHIIVGNTTPFSLTIRSSFFNIDIAQSTDSIHRLLSRQAKQNTILLTIVDEPYLRIWRNSYYYGNLSQYDNLVVMCLNRRTYTVRFILPNYRFYERKEYQLFIPVWDWMLPIHHLLPLKHQKNSVQKSDGK